MSITINIYYTGKSGNAKKFAEEMVANRIVEDIRAEDGNLKYEYFFPNNYTLHKLFIDCDIMNCCKMKLYGVKSPNNIINKYIVHHVKNFDKNKNTK
jgi:hypothetical protein